MDMVSHVTVVFQDWKFQGSPRSLSQKRRTAPVPPATANMKNSRAPPPPPPQQEPEATKYKGMLQTKFVTRVALVTPAKQPYNTANKADKHGKHSLRKAQVIVNACARCLGSRAGPEHAACGWGEVGGGAGGEGGEGNLNKRQGTIEQRSKRADEETTHKETTTSTKKRPIAPALYFMDVVEESKEEEWLSGSRSYVCEA